MRRLIPVLIVISNLFLGFEAAAGPYSALVAEIETERVLFERNAGELRHPASLTKMMTLYLVFESLVRGEISNNTRLRASRFAIMRPPSKLGLQAGDTITVEQGILALVTRSANDAAATIAEGLAGSESAFAYVMTEKAHQLGMSRTVFRNASGLPDPNQVTTAWDMFRLAKSLNKHFPQYYPYFSTSNFYFEGRNFHNHNHLLKNYPGADGVKTGFINASGFNLVASAKRNGNRLIGVVFGGTSATLRDAHMRDILDDGFAQLEGRESRVRTAAFDQPERLGLLRRPRLAEGDEPRLRGRTLAGDETPEPGRDEDDGATGKRSWQVRVGQFPREQAAEQRLSQALKVAPYPFRNARATVTSHTRRGKRVYVAYFKSMSREDALLACRTLKKKRMECSSLR
jgi:D-alanyl-D-alanine carboxypeptidase